MGDFSMSCALSGLTLQDQRVVLIPLRATKQIANGCALVNHGSQSMYLFQARCFPIFGELDCYGRLENIEQNANTEEIARTYRMPIEKFAEVITFGENFVDPDTRDAEINCGVGCYIHREIYDRFAKPIREEAYKDTLYDEYTLQAHHLTALGGKVTGETEEDSEIYTFSEWPGFEIIKKGYNTWAIWNRSKFRLNKIRDSEKSLPPGFVEKSKVRGRIYTNIQHDVEMLKWRIKTEMEMSVALNEIGSDLVRKDMRTEDLRAALFQCVYLREFGFDRTYFWNMWDSGMLEKDGINRAVEFYYLLWSFSLLNRLLMPTCVGTQYPEDKNNLVLCKAVEEIAKERIQRYG